MWGSLKALIQESYSKTFSSDLDLGQDIEVFKAILYSGDRSHCFNPFSYNYLKIWRKKVTHLKGYVAFRLTESLEDDVDILALI